MGAEAIAAGLNLPYMKFTCSANTEIYDFIGQIFPDSENASTGDATLDKELQQLKARRHDYANIAKVMELPPLDDMDYDPSGVFKKLTGTDKSDATTQECMELVLEKVTRKVDALSKRVDPKKDGGQRFSYIETDFIKALKNGYVIEIQEPTVIMPARRFGGTQFAFGAKRVYNFTYGRNHKAASRCGRRGNDEYCLRGLQRRKPKYYRPYEFGARRRIAVSGGNETARYERNGRNRFV